MSDTTIEWTDKTWNPTTGCDQVSPGCDNCYALTLAGRLKAMGSKRYQNDGDPRTSGPGFGLTLHHDKLDEPLHWRTPKRVFVNSMSDLFHPDVPGDFIAEVFAVMALADQHQFQVLTKRPQAMARRLNNDAFVDDIDTARLRRQPLRIMPDWPRPNIWLGTSIESDRWTFRANHLRATPAAVRFLSLEPLLGPLPSLNLDGIDWVIVGGESGPNARPMHPYWVRDIRDRCQAAGIPFFFKQWGAWHPAAGPIVLNDPAWILKQCSNDAHWFWTFKHGKKNYRELDGRTWDQYPESVTV